MVHAKEPRRLLGACALGLAALVALLPSRPAHAYIDPNSAGQIYQFLFPVLIAAASAIAALRRYIARLWYRLVNAVVTVVRRERAPPQSGGDG
ncbi:MAG TPA: hypothetical protein VMD56_03235 [Steroidobacteraceae bacterium]|nr:hypothetical protein [Steroidobacteraceae bacterium]